MAKKISGEYFVDNRDFCPVGNRVRNLIKGKIEDKRRETARKKVELEENQKKHRERIFKALGVDMPLPEMTEKEYLDKCIPMDAWLYVQYGAILFPQPDGSIKISEDGQKCLTDLEDRGKTLAEINGAASPKKNTPEEQVKSIQWGGGAQKEKEAVPKTPEKQAEENKQEKKNKPEADCVENGGGHSVQPDNDLLAPIRKQAELKEKRRKKIRFLKNTVVGSVGLLTLLSVSLLIWRFLT